MTFRGLSNRGIQTNLNKEKYDCFHILYFLVWLSKIWNEECLFKYIYIFASLYKHQISFWKVNLRLSPFQLSISMSDCWGGEAQSTLLCSLKCGNVKSFSERRIITIKCKQQCRIMLISDIDKRSIHCNNCSCLDAVNRTDKRQS